MKIEARVWDKKKKVMIENAHEEWSCASCAIEYGGWQKGDEFLSFQDYLKNPKRFVTELWISLKDKNGKKIFDGDILSWEYKGEKYIFYCAWDEYNLEFRFTGNIISPRFDRSMLEVIGNIHENPELMK